MTHLLPVGPTAQLNSCRLFDSVYSKAAAYITFKKHLPLI